VDQFNQFWTFNIGHLLTVLTLLVSFWAAHHANARAREEDVKDRQEMKTKLDLIYDWFQNNVVGRGESHRGGRGD